MSAVPKAVVAESCSISKELGDFLNTLPGSHMVIALAGIFDVLEKIPNPANDKVNRMLAELDVIEFEEVKYGGFKSEPMVDEFDVKFDHVFEFFDDEIDGDGLDDIIRDMDNWECVSSRVCELPKLERELVMFRDVRFYVEVVEDRTIENLTLLALWLIFALIFAFI